MQRAPQTASPVRPRKFDWETARAMRDDGCSFAELGKFFGVTPAAVQFAIKQLEYAETGVWTGAPTQEPGRHKQWRGYQKAS